MLRRISLQSIPAQKFSVHTREGTLDVRLTTFQGRTLIDLEVDGIPLRHGVIATPRENLLGGDVPFLAFTSGNGYVLFKDFSAQTGLYYGTSAEDASEFAAL